jgi:DNA/RNA endonuclease YhcR with UshA esterase domain
MSDRRGSTDPQAGGDLPDLFEVEVTTKTDAIQEFFKRFQVDVGCRHPHTTRNDDGTLTVLVYASEEQIREIEESGYRVKRGENVTAVGRERQAEVGKGDRFEGGRTFPEGLGKLTRNDREEGAS